MSKFNQEYFEDGLSSGISCYENYRWIPELTFPLAHNIIKKLHINDNDIILDYGCAKGYLVKAMRLLGYDCYGCDISKYAISHIDRDIEKVCFLIESGGFDKYITKVDWLISKDVFEHMDENSIDRLFERANDTKVGSMFHVIPLGDDGQFRIPEYHFDKTHIQIQNEDWWTKKFESYGWNVEFNFLVEGIKDKWTTHHYGGDGFFILTK